MNQLCRIAIPIIHVKIMSYISYNFVIPARPESFFQKDSLRVVDPTSGSDRQRETDYGGHL